MNKIEELKIVNEYYLKNINNNLVFLMDQCNEKNILEECIVAGYYFQDKDLIIYLETEVSKRIIIISKIEARSMFKLKRKKVLTFIENASIPFSYDLELISEPN